MPATKTTGNSRPLAECTVIIVTADVWPASASRSERSASHSMRAGSLAEAGPSGASRGSGPGAGATGASPASSGFAPTPGWASAAPARRRLGHALEHGLDVVVGLVELGDAHAEELADVLDAPLGLGRALGLVGAHDPRLVDDRLHDVGELPVERAAGLDGVGQNSCSPRRALPETAPSPATAARAAANSEQPVLDRPGAQAPDRGGAHAAPRRVDHALAAHVVGRHSSTTSLR